MTTVPTFQNTTKSFVLLRLLRLIPFISSIVACALTAEIASAAPSLQRYSFNENQIELRAALEKLEANGQAEALRGLLLQKALSLGIEMDAATLKAKIDDFWATTRQVSQKRAVPRFPVLPLTLFKGITKEKLLQMAEYQTAHSKTPPAVTFVPLEQEWASLFSENCNEKPSAKTPIMPGLTTGHSLDTRLSACFVHQSIVLARILGRMTSGESAPLTIGDSKVSSATDLFAELMRTGHEVVVRIEKTYANFIDLNLEGRSIIWPVWIDTGLPLKGSGPTRNLLVPAGHSQIAWTITGPKINADVTFYLGVDGLGFYPRIFLRPRWTGWSHRLLADSKVDTAGILRSIRIANEFTLQNILDSSGLPNDGYGFVGVCNDSAGYVESKMGYELSLYPMARNPSLGGDLPFDLLPPATEAEARGQLRRVLETQPQSRGNLQILDPQLAKDLKQAEESLKE
jgi:hypothetical protein